MTIVQRTKRSAVVLAISLAVSMLLLAFHTVAVSADGRDWAPSTASAIAGSQVQSEFPLSPSSAFSTFLPLLIRHFPAFAFNDTFAIDRACNGWPVHSLDLNEPNPPGPWSAHCGNEKLSPKTYSVNGVYSFKTGAAWNSWIYPAPVVLADPRNFTITVDGKSAQDFMWASSWGVYFNANASRTRFYTVQIYQTGVVDLDTSPDYSVRRWDNFTGGATDDNLILVPLRKCRLCQAADFEWNRIIIRRQGDLVYIYAGDTYNPAAFDRPLIILSLPAYTGSEYTGVGLYQGNFEWMNWHGDEPSFQADNFNAFPVYIR